MDCTSLDFEESPSGAAEAVDLTRSTYNNSTRREDLGHPTLQKWLEIHLAADPLAIAISQGIIK